jgi:3,4-dihydroxyphenylacetate 2,3-dioxygenase
VGEIVGAGIVSHVPPIVMSEQFRRSLTADGSDISLVTGLRQLRAEVLDVLEPDTIIVFDTHWFTTFEHVVSAHDRRQGLFTSDELPRGMAQMPYDYAGDPELAHAIEALTTSRSDTWSHATSDPYVAVHYPTINLLGFLQRDERWMSVGTCQTAEPADFLLFGSVIAEAVASLDRRVVLLASGGLSHRFWSLREIRHHESVGLEHISSQSARRADERVLELLGSGNHAQVIEEYPQFRAHAPEGWFGHYLMMVGALGGSSCRAPGRLFGNYEAAAGTGQAHVWFDRPATGW